MASPTGKTKSAHRRGGKAGKEAGQPRINIEIARLEAQCAEGVENSWQTIEPSSKRPEPLKPITIDPLIDSFNKVPPPTERQVLVLLRSNGVAPLVYRFFKDCDTEGLEAHLEAHDNDVLRAGQGIIEIGKAVSASMDTAGHNPSAVACIRYSKALANRNQDIFFEVFGFSEADSWDIMLVCAVLLMTAFVDRRKYRHGFFNKLLASGLRMCMPHKVRCKWNKKYSLPSTNEFFVQAQEESDVDEVDQEEMEKLALSYEEVPHHETTALTLGPWTAEEQLAFFKAWYFQQQKANAPDLCRRVADLMLRRNYWECLLFSRENADKLSMDIVKPQAVETLPPKSKPASKPTAAASTKKRKFEQVESVNEEAEAQKKFARERRIMNVAKKEARTAAQFAQDGYDAMPREELVPHFVREKAKLQKQVEGGKGLLKGVRYHYKGKVKCLEARIEELEEMVVGAADLIDDMEEANDGSDEQGGRGWPSGQGSAPEGRDEGD